jgi:dihydropteroate synthase
MRTLYSWKLQSRTLQLGSRTLVMGVLNVTPDSFSDGGRYANPDAAVAHGLRLLDEGADILDIGGESTRPGAAIQGDSGDGPSVSAKEELDRILPVIEAIGKQRPAAILSVDTYKSQVARAGVDAGAEIVNDVSGFEWDRAMASTCARLQCGVVLMHTRGRPNEWKGQEPADDIVREVEHNLANRVQTAFGAGVERDRIVLDPGFGFGKNSDENYALVGEFSRFHEMGFPLLAGASRKGFISRSIEQRTGDEVIPADRLYGSIAAMVACILQGAHIVRVHDVKPSVEAAAVADAILAKRRSFTTEFTEGTEEGRP